MFWSKPCKWCDLQSDSMTIFALRNPTLEDKVHVAYRFWINTKDKTYWMNDFRATGWVQLIKKEG
jgi:hypothetical protein